MTAKHQIKRLIDYTAPEFTIDAVNLDITLDPKRTVVKSTLTVRRLSNTAKQLRLDGAELELVSVAFGDSQQTLDYQLAEDALTILIPTGFESFTLKIVNVISPESNTSLEGLYCSNGAFCTQCEAEGFRKITYYLDRPDVLAKFSVLINGDRQQYPRLLSNGNLVNSGTTNDGRHWAEWVDPHPKPCYLFALVAGDFDLLEDRYVTADGRDVALQLFVDKGQKERGYHALESLKNAMKWDEDVFGLSYDLDIYMVVAVDFFNMGAMENKGLNVFNSKYVLANSESATDTDYFNIESIIGHEYFHNWTGNRVTCRDWFQLSLKEGLTVFRDQQFSNDMSSPLVNRINSVRVMREHQFTEDAGPMSHPIRPEQVIEMNNFYTVTVYDKGAEVIRMLHTLLGQSKFRQGMDLYFERHDGCAVTCDDFVNAMEDASATDLSLFRRWYSQSGTPVVSVKSEYHAESNSLRLHCEQQTPVTADQKQKLPLHIPMSIEFIDHAGMPIVINGGSTSVVQSLTDAQQTFTYDLPVEPAAVSLFQHFSAPVKVKYDASLAELQHLITYASDDFNRWDAMQSLYQQCITEAYQNASSDIFDCLQSTLIKLIKNADGNTALLAECLQFPSLESIFQSQGGLIDIHRCYETADTIKQRLAKALLPHVIVLLNAIPVYESYDYQAHQVDDRRLKATLNVWLAISGEMGTDYWHQRYQECSNMTDTLNLLSACQYGEETVFNSLMADFEAKWRGDVLVLDKWFSLKAGANNAEPRHLLDELMSHPSYTINNPNRVRSVWGSFCRNNALGFHNLNGTGYQLLADYLLKLDKVNPQISARLVEPLMQAKRYANSYQESMNQALIKLNESELSPDLYEKVSKALH